MPKKYVVELSAEERGQLEELVNKGRSLARRIEHARSLLKADQGVQGPGWSDARIAQAYDVSVLTVGRIRQRLVEHGLQDALARRQHEQAMRRKLDGAAEAKLIALACGAPPQGRGRWTIRLLADKLVELEIVNSVGRETLRKTLKKMSLSPG
jgi:transposase